jgi:hypothetical protein
MTRFGEAGARLARRPIWKNRLGRGVQIAVMALLMLANPLTAQAQSNRLPPAIESLTAPFSDGELVGIGCLAGTVVASGTVIALAAATSRPPRQRFSMRLSCIGARWCGSTVACW